MLILPVAAAVGCLVAGLLLGKVWGERTLWRDLWNDPSLGHQALEKLAQRHGAKLELWQGPGGR